MAIFTSEQIGKIYDEYVEKVYKFFYYKFLDQEIAEDLTSKVMMKFIEKAKADEPIRQPGNFIFGIAKLLYLEELREKYKLTTTELKDYHQQIEEVEIEGFVEERNSKKTLEDIAGPFISQLPEKQQLVITLRLLEKMTIAEVCAKLDVSSRYVRTTQNRAINNLKDMIAGLKLEKLDLDEELEVE